MGFARPLLKNLSGLRFYKLLGAGKGVGFSLIPDWGRYAFLGVWENEEEARNFLATSSFMANYRSRTKRVTTVIGNPISAHGNWNGKNPFLPLALLDEELEAPIAVLTRATIRPWKFKAFWSQVPPLRALLIKTPGLLGTIGVGEAPFFRQATFSLWENQAALKKFAYQTSQHRQAISRTRQEKWYSEELFARFKVVEIIGEFP